MPSTTLLVSVAIVLIATSLFGTTLGSPLGNVRQQTQDENNLANLRGFVNDLKSKLRGEFALLMALQNEADEGKGD